MDQKKFNNPFRRANDTQEEKSKKESEWGKVKFNPVIKSSIIEQATPWSQFKSEIVRQQQDNEYESRMNNNENAQEILKKREENYRRNLITSKRNQPTQWEDFSDETSPNPSSSFQNKFRNKGRFHQLQSNIKNIDSIKKKDFDSKLLTNEQNNYIKKLITRDTLLKRGGFKTAVGQLKFEKFKKESKRKTKN